MNRKIGKKVFSAKMLLVALLMACIAVFSCHKNSDPEVIIPLQGSKWKLSGIYDMPYDTLIMVLEPKNCDTCYTLSFETDHFATVQCINVRITLDLLNLSSGCWHGEARVDEMYEGERYNVNPFENGIKRANAYSTPSDSVLKIYYCDSSKYLLFKRIQP
jgi:hypothetical protein